MDKFSELKAAALAATPGPWNRTLTRFNGITNSTHSMASFSSEGVLANANEKRDAIFIAAANPAVVLDLLAELEASRKQNQELAQQCGRSGVRATIAERKLAAKDKRIAELEVERTGSINELSRIIQQETKARREVEKLLEDGLEKWQELASTQCIKINELQDKLATPVRLTDERTLWAGEDDYDTGHVKGWNANRIEQATLLKKQGFTVEGDE